MWAGKSTHSLLFHGIVEDVRVWDEMRPPATKILETPPKVKDTTPALTSNSWVGGKAVLPKGISHSLRLGRLATSRCSLQASLQAIHDFDIGLLLWNSCRGCWGLNEASCYGAGSIHTSFVRCDTFASGLPARSQLPPGRVEATTWLSKPVSKGVVQTDAWNRCRGYPTR